MDYARENEDPSEQKRYDEIIQLLEEVVHGIVRVIVYNVGA